MIPWEYQVSFLTVAPLQLWSIEEVCNSWNSELHAAHSMLAKKQLWYSREELNIRYDKALLQITFYLVTSRPTLIISVHFVQ